ncbi:hypothetical protein IWX49DRAFT_594209 [Phyllosticta citricarpa]|uniref:Uncharacterized protein n=1 Tax=Phyllosticta citricarpa TaxID=55181 RepID=A0ABR1LIE5_9PEZI
MGAILMRALEHSGNGDTLGSGNLFGSGNSSPIFILLVFILVFGAIQMAGSVAILLATPAMLLNIYRGKFYSTQARIFGVEGRINLGVTESYVLGFSQNRLKLDKNGSSLGFDDLGRPK